MSELRKSVLDQEDRFFKSATVCQWKYPESGYRTVGLQMDGFTTIPCANDAYETRVYEIVSPGKAIKIGIYLIRFGVDSVLKNVNPLRNKFKK